MTKLLALDQASLISGWSVFIDNHLTEYGVIETHQENIGERLVTIRTEVLSIIKKYNIDHIALEDIQLQRSVGNNVHTFKVLAQVQGTIIELAQELNIPYIVIPSVTWKSYLNIKGRNRPEQKRNAQTYIENNFHIKVKQDICDSICIGLYACGPGFKAEEGHDWSN